MTLGSSSAMHRGHCRTWRLVFLLAPILLGSVWAAANADYYRLLGVRRTADTATIKKAYKDLAKKYHPDKFKGSAPLKMEDLNRAHEVLTDPELRKTYDMYGKDPEGREVQRAEERLRREQEYTRQMHNILNQGGRRNQQYIPSDTQTLTSHNYDELVNGLRQVWLIQVWRDTHCPHCLELAPAWEEAAKELKGVVHFGRINYDRNGALLSFRLRQLPTIFAVSAQGEVRLMNGRNGYSAEEIVSFASGIVTAGSSVARIDASGSAQRFLSKTSHQHKVRAILFDRSDWAAYHSAAAAAAWKDSIVFAVYTRPNAADPLVREYGVSPNERTLVLVRQDGSIVKKSGLRSRKVLVRHLLLHQYPLVTEVRLCLKICLCPRALCVCVSSCLEAWEAGAMCV